jgi:hypothetical protein
LLKVCKPLNKAILFFALTFIGFLQQVSASNIVVTNVSLAGQNVSAGVNANANFTYIEFDLSWDNSWRTSASPVNWDAAWVFVKYRTVGTSTWNHVKLAPSGHNSSGTGTGYSVRTGLVDESAVHNATTNPAVGAFIYRSANGTGSFSASDIRLKWFYRDNGVGDNDIVDVDVYAIEMVNVPEGSFWLGNNGSGTGSAFYAYGVSSAGYQVSSEASFSYCSPQGAPSAGTLIIPYSGGTNAITMAANFPKGFGSFYCMKYEASQQIYVDFLNSLTSSQQTARQPGGTNNRNGISSTSGVYSTTTPFVPVSFIGVVDLMSFMDWAGLRPISEMEFEKACRGTASAVTNEYAWGTTNLTAAGTAYTNGGTSTEVSATSGANAAIRGGQSGILSQGPIRCGAFATSSTTRESAGASFYGIMELSGNLIEAAVVATITYNGKIHGNGTLHAGGNADISSWPGFSSSTNSTLGSLFLGRGGSYDASSYNDAALSRVADRQIFYGYTTVGYPGYNVKGSSSIGIRGVRSESSITTVETK